MATGYSVPTSELDGSSNMNLSNSSGSVNAHEAPAKKAKPTSAEVQGVGGSCILPSVGRALPALPATVCSLASVRLHGQTSSSSDSSVSGVTSRASRQRQAMAAANRALADARVRAAEALVEEIAAKDAESIAGSAGRRLEDVRSDQGEDVSHQPLPTDGTDEYPPTPTLLSEATGSASSAEAGLQPLSSIYDEFSQRIGNADTEEMFTFNQTFPIVPSLRSSSSAEAGTTPPSMYDLMLVELPSAEAVMPSDALDIDMFTPTVGVWGAKFVLGGSWNGFAYLHIEPHN